jgi:hypothetical protein
VSGVSTLFSEEWYRHVKRYLKDDGLLVQWIQTYDISVDLLASIFKALGNEYRDYVIYRVGAVDLLIIATPTGKVPQPTAAVFEMPGTAADLAHLGYRNADDLKALRIAGRAAIEPIFALSANPANSDFFPVLDQNAPRARFRGDSAKDLRTSRDNLVPVVQMLDEESRTPLERISSSGVNRPIRSPADAGGRGIDRSAPHRPDRRRSRARERGSRERDARARAPRALRGSGARVGGRGDRDRGIRDAVLASRRRAYRLRNGAGVEMLGDAERSESRSHPPPRGDQRPRSRAHAEARKRAPRAPARLGRGSQARAAGRGHGRDRA